MTSTSVHDNLMNYDGSEIVCSTEASNASKSVTVSGKVGDTITIYFANENTADPSSLSLQVIDGSTSRPYSKPLRVYANGVLSTFPTFSTGSETRTWNAGARYTFHIVNPDHTGVSEPTWCLVNSDKEDFVTLYKGTLGANTSATLSDSIVNYRAVVVVGSVYDGSEQKMTQFIPRAEYFMYNSNVAFILNGSIDGVTRRIYFGFKNTDPTKIFTGNINGDKTPRIRRVYGIL